MDENPRTPTALSEVDTPIPILSARHTCASTPVSPSELSTHLLKSPPNFRRRRALSDSVRVPHAEPASAGRYPLPADHPRPREGADAPRPRVSGKFLEVGGRRLWLAGVTYGTFAPGDDGQQFGSPEQVDADFRAMAATGVTALRTYTVPPHWLLDAALRHGLWVMVGLPWEQHVAFLEGRRQASDIERRVREGVRSCAGHPAVLCYAVGNEVPAPIVRWHGHAKVERFLERLYRAAKDEDPEALVTYVSFPSTEYLDLPFVDFLCFNVYLEAREGLAAYLARLQNIAGEKPLVMAEIGLDSRRNGVATQARALEWQIATAFEGGCAGAFLFAWTDEWHRGGEEVGDWDFGLTDRERQPKPALRVVQQAFEELPFAVAASSPRISVVVCTHNGAETLDECLTGLGRLRYPEYEVIVVDDGSADASAAIAESHGVRLIRTENRGLSAARNTGLRAATGEIVAYIDDDAFPDPHWLAYVELALRTSDHAGVGGPNLPVPGDGLTADAVAGAPGGPLHVLLSDTVAEHIPGCNMAYRRNCLIAVGGFDEQFRVAGDDVDVCWKLQEEGWTLGFHPAAMVWHHRRGSVRRFWRQQRGYGRAEALLERKWPEKYNTPGHLTWAGRLYGRGSAPWRRSRVYYGIWGSGAFQPGIDRPQQSLTALAAAPEWYLVVGALAGLSALGAVASPLLLALPLLALAVAMQVAQALQTAARAARDERSRPRRLALGALTTLLVLMQPAARLGGRLAHGLAPWRRARLGASRLPRPRVVTRWYESWRSFADRVGAIEGTLHAAGARVRRGGECDRWELQAFAGAAGGVRLRAVIEEHGAGRQLMRVALRPHAAGFVRSGLAGLATLVVAAALAREWETTAIAAALLVSLAAYAAAECGRATAAALTALDAAEAVEPARQEAPVVAEAPAGSGASLDRAGAAA